MPYPEAESDREALAQGHGDGVADDQQPHRARSVGPGALQRGVLGARETGRQRGQAGAGCRRSPWRRPPATAVAAPAEARAGSRQARQRDAGGAQQAPHHRSRHLSTVLLAADRPHPAAPGPPDQAGTLRPGRRARLLGIGASRDSLERLAPVTGVPRGIGRRSPAPPG